MKRYIIPIFFAEFALASEKVIFSAYQTQTTVQESTSDVYLITKEDIEEIKPHSIIELLNTVPSISFSSNGGFGQASSFYLRGFRQKYSLVMIDGVRIDDPSNLNGVSLEHILPVDIERIEIIKGSQSSVWGADAVAGIINIITKKPRKGFSANSYFEYGSFVTRKYGTTLGYSDEKLYISLGLHRFDSQSISAAEPGKSSRDYGKRWNELKMEPDPYRNDTVSMKLGLNITPQDKIETNMRFIDAVVHYDGYDSNFKLVDANNIAHINQKFYNLLYQKNLGSNSLDLYLNYADFQKSYLEPNGWIPYSIYKGKEKEYGFRNKWSYIENSFLQIGFVRQYFSENDTIVNKSYRNTGLFLTNLNRMKNFIFTQSLRYDNYSAFDDKLTYKFGGKVFISKDLAVSANYSSAYKVPMLYQLYSPFGNPNLKPEKSKNFDIGLSFDGFSLSYFNYKVENMIDFDSTYKYKNLDGVSKFHGFEFSFQEYIKPVNIAVSGGYTYTWAVDSNGKKYARVPQDKININLAYYPIQSLNIRLGGEYIGKRRDNNIQTGYYTLFNLAINYHFNKSLQCYIKIDNLTDKFYQTIDGYASASRSIYAGLNLAY